MRVTFFTASLALAALAFSPVTVSAQSFGGIGGSGEPFDVSVDPQFPLPYASATLSFTSATINLPNATLKVGVNGKDIYTGNVRPVSVPLGRAGSVASVLATITLNGDVASRTVSIQPQGVTLIAEPAASAPPLYQGRPAVPIGGNVRVVAAADLRDAAGARLDPSVCSYAWTIDGARIDAASGIGKNTIIVAAPFQYRSRSVSVTVSNRDGSLRGGATVSLVPEQPVMRIYRYDPLLGILFDHALSGSYAIQGAEDTLYAAPFFLPTTSALPMIRWSLNKTVEQTGKTITLRPSGEGQGSTLLSAVASVSSTLKTSADLSISFGTRPGGLNLFGL